jgi:hypothetical protein
MMAIPVFCKPPKLLEDAKDFHWIESPSITIRDIAQNCLFDDYHPWHQRLHRLILEGMVSYIGEEILCLDDSFAKKVEEVFLILINSPQFTSAYEQRKAFHTAFVEAFTHLRYRREGGDAATCRLQALARAFFMGPQLFSFSREVVFTFTDLPEMGEEKLSAIIQRDFQAIDEAPSFLRRSNVEIAWGCLRGHLNYCFTPLRENNFSYFLYADHFVLNSGAKQRVLCLRLGCPTQEGLWYRAQILEEFRAFLDSYRQSEERHLYFNLQSPFPKRSWQGDETGRIKALMDLGKEYPETFFPFTFPLDGDFFEKNTTTQFAKEFTQALQRNQHGIFIPREQISHSIDDDISQIVQGVWEDFFEKKEDLSILERKLFICFTYLRLQEYFCVLLCASSYNRSCKDAIDRAAILNAGGFYLGKVEDGDISSHHPFPCPCSKKSSRKTRSQRGINRPLRIV